MNDALYFDILMFIGRFSTKMDGSGYSEDMIDHFTKGLCYWFAYILSVRFAAYAPEIVHDDVACHFGCEIDGRVYDIRGDVTDDYDWKPWQLYDDEAHKRRIEEQCIMF